MVDQKTFQRMSDDEIFVKTPFRQMTDDEIRWELRHIAIHIAISCQHCDDPIATFKTRVVQELGCPYVVDISFLDQNDSGQWRWTGTVASPTTGKVIDFSG